MIKTLLGWCRKLLGRRPAGRKTALVGMPTYGPVTAGAAKGLFRASRGERLSFNIDVEEGSLLAANMNKLWCAALNAERCDYFAMQHGDIEPEDWWLDLAIEELEARKLDVLGVVAPIKDTLGLTSIAMARPDGDTWRVHGRLTMDEIYRLPETFTSDDVGYPLLLNTGLWVCRFDRAWAKKVHFTINDRIVCCPDGSFLPQCEPEDWFFSRLLHELGLRIGCTRKVRLGHRGPMCFANTEPWGQQQFDAAYLERSVLEGRKRQDWFPYDVDGWLSEDEGRALSELARGKRVLEIGSYCGKSTICLARTAAHVTAVDPHDGRGTPRPKDTAAEMDCNLQRYGVRSRVEIIKATSQRAGLDRQRGYDVAFIDGAHDYESVVADKNVALGVLKRGGLLAFHDYRWGTPQEGFDPGVERAVNEMLAGGEELVARHGSIAVVRPGAVRGCAA